MNLIETVEQKYMKSNVTEFRPGYTVKVHLKVKEGNKERIQVFEGIVISKNGGGINETFTVMKTAAGGVVVERVFLVHSPMIEKLEVVRKAAVRRAKLRYLTTMTRKRAMQKLQKKKVIR